MHRHSVLPRQSRSWFQDWTQSWAKGLAIVLATLSVSACAETTLGQAAGPAARAYDAADPAVAPYQAKLAAYEQAHGAYAAEAKVYWNAITEKRKLRRAKRRKHQRIAANDYVLTQPPIYSGPPRPKNPFAPPTAAGREERNSGGRRLPRSRARTIRLCARPAAQRARIQARLCGGGHGGRARQGPGGRHLRFRDRRPRRLRHAGRLALRPPGRARDFAGARLQSVPEHARPFRCSPSTATMWSRLLQREGAAAFRRSAPRAWRARSSRCAA